MRVTCPNCGAVYEVPDGAIPESGRDVQCTSCGHGWFQRPEAREAPRAAEVIEAEPADEESFAGPPPPVDPRLRRVLREEAEREVEARRAERRGASRSAEDAHPRRQASRGTGRRADPRDVDEVGLSRARPRDDGVRRRRRRGGGGFVLGFLGTLVVAGILAAGYVFADDVVEAAPSLTEPMAGYVETITRGRLALDAAAAEVRNDLEDILPSPTGDG